MKQVSFFLLAFLGSFLSQAQELWTLEQASQQALQNNLQIQVAGFDRQIAESRVQEVYKTLLPQISFDGRYQYLVDIPVQLIPGEIFGQAGRTVEAQFGVAQSTSGTFQASQIVYNPSVIVATKAAKTAAELSDLQLKQQKENLIYSLSATYYNLQTVKKQVEFVVSNQKNIEKLLATTELLVKGGLAKQLDADRLKVSLQNLKSNEENLKVLENKLSNLLKIQMGLELTKDIQISEIEETVEKIEIPTSIRTELQLLEKNKRLVELDRQNINAGYLPSINAFASLGYTAYNNQFNPFAKKEGTRWYPTTVIGLQMSFSIFDGMQKYQKAKTKNLEINKLEKQRLLLTQNIEMESLNAQNQYQQSQTALEFQKQNLELAQKNYTNVSLQYKEGITPFSELISSENALKEAQTNFLNEIVKLRIAELELKKATGNLLAK